jgi:hypothetical protein
MTQVLWNFLPELAVDRKNAVECVAPFILWVSRGGADPHGTSNDGDQKNEFANCRGIDDVGYPWLHCRDG